MESVIQESINENIDISAFDLGGANFVEVDFLENYQLTKKLFSNIFISTWENINVYDLVPVWFNSEKCYGIRKKN